jgi:tetratricopeptide (TPR) repeat protein
VVDGNDSVLELRRRLDTHPPERYPVQHATTRFHLGVVLAKAGRLREAEESLRRATDLFDRHKLPVEYAKTLVALGAVLREQALFDEAAACFAEAASLFSTRRAALEEGAATFNLGLVQRQTGRVAEAVESLNRARSLLDPARVPGQAAAATRELGGALFQLGRLDEAVPVLEQAISLAERGGDLAGLGGAANVLGLVHLASGRPKQAADQFRNAVGANPRGMRPESYAMAKANLGLAYDELGDISRARLAAAQAIAVADVPEPVLVQAKDVLERLGPVRGDLFVVLDDDSLEDRPATAREELVRWVAVSVNETSAEVRAWIEAQTARANGVDLAEVMLGGLLELPPPAMESIIRAVVGALELEDESVQELFRSQVSSAMARFPIPQWTRLKDTFYRAASELGYDAAWS